MDPANLRLCFSFLRKHHIRERSVMKQSTRIIELMLFLGSIVAAPLSFALACLIGNVEIFGLAGMTYIWLMLPFSIIPMSSLVFGAVALKNGNKTKKNIIVGCIVSFFMIVLGFYSFSIDADRSGDFLKNVSAQTGISLPQKTESASYHDFDGKIGNAILTDNGEKLLFEETIVSDDRWVEELPPASKGILPSMLVVQLSSFDYYCLHVGSENVFNPIDLASGNYTLTLFSYKSSKSHLCIFYDYNVVV